jgi:integrase
MPDAQPTPLSGPLPRGYLLALNRSFRRTLEAENKSPRTVEAYTDAVRLLATYLQAHDSPILAGELRLEHIQEFIADQLARWKPATAHTRYRGLHAFFKWAVAEGDLAASPMDGMRPPQTARATVEVVRAEQLSRLLRTCEGRDFTSRRDTAIILLLVDTGMCRAECVGMTLDDVDLDQRMVWCSAKVTDRGRFRLAARPLRPGPLPANPGRTSPSLSAAPLGRAQWTHDSLGRTEVVIGRSPEEVGAGRGGLTSRRLALRNPRSRARPGTTVATYAPRSVRGDRPRWMDRRRGLR